MTIDIGGSPRSPGSVEAGPDRAEPVTAGWPESAAPEDAVLARRWLAAGYSSELDAGPLAARLLGRDLVVARLGDRLLATFDRCPHRGARLAPGDIVDDPTAGPCLACPYHGLRFDADGAPVRLPARPESRLPGRLALPTLPVAERHGIVWVALTDDPIGGLPDWSAYDDPDRLRFQLTRDTWEAMPSRIVENFNDLAHFATVHAGTFGDPDHPEVPAIELTAEAIPDEGSPDEGSPAEGTEIRHHVLMHQLDRVTLDGPLVPVEVRFSYVHHFPFATELVIDYDAERTEWIQMVVSPIGPTTSLVLQQNVRNFDLDDPVADWHDFQAAVNVEDKIVLEGLVPRRQPIDGRASATEAAADEVALPVDAFTTAYRRWWTAALAALAAPAATGSPVSGSG